jgi:hypothetical protein
MMGDVYMEHTYELTNVIEYATNELDDIEKYYNESYDYDFTTMFTEASPNKPPIHIRVWNVIKRIINAIKNFFIGLINKIKRFFSSFKKKPVTMNQILEACGFHSKSKYHQEADAPTAEKETTVHFYAAKGSAFPEKDLKILSNHLLMKIEHDDFVVRAPGIQSGLQLKGPSRTADWQEQYYITAILLTESGFDDAISDIMNMLVYDESKGGLIDMDPEFISAIQNLINRLYNPSLLNKMANSTITWHRHDLMRFQKEINDASSVIEKVQAVQGINKDQLRALNQFADLLLVVTIGMNEFHRAIDHMYMIDRSYIGCIDDSESLDKYVHHCVDNGIPAKFIAYNTWLLLNKAWRLHEKTFYTDKIEPKWGQTRTVFDLKDDEVVAKIAMSGVGIRCNRNEVSITDEYKREGTDDVLACVVASMPYCALIFPQKIDPYWKMDQDDVMELKDKLHDIYWDHPKLHDIRNDLHVDNIGKIDANVVCIDYGDIKIVGR